MREKLELKPSINPGEASIMQAELKLDDQPPAPIFPAVELSLLPTNIGGIDILPSTIVELFHE